ncbi:MAG: serine/threonine-protein kinase [Acidobacteriota bacterium]|nr:serine/threonine-protein kinase [Acidobacteriota bacterium]
MTVVTGTKLGPYEILSPLGAGGMGEVYRARDTRLGREVALKLLPESFSQDPDRLARFEQEAKAVAALNHPNIMAIHDIGEQGGVPYLVSELLEGNSLRAEMDHGKLSPRKAVDYAVQMAQGLSAAHDKNIIHRDLKPENAFVTREGRVKILDFGLAKLARNGGSTDSESVAMTLTNAPTEAGKVLGTVGYMAPEQVRGSMVDSRTDIFAFGAVLYEMVSGQRAFRRDTAAETMTAILKEDPPEFDDLTHPVSPGLERIVRRCLEKKPEQRFQSAKDLAFALEALTGTSTKTAANPVIEDQTKSRRWMLAAAAIPLALGLGAVLGWLAKPGPGAPPAFKQVSFHRGDVIHARFAPDGKTLVYAAKLNGGQPDTYVLREEYPEPVSAGLQGAVILSVSRPGQLAVLTKPHYFAHRAWIGTLATSPLGGGAPREILENVSDADWSPDGNQMAIIDQAKTTWRLQYPLGKILWQGENWISDVRVSPDGKRLAYFLHPPNVDDRGDVMLVDADGKIRALSKDWESLEGLAWQPSGNEVWFSATKIGGQYCIQAVNLSGKQRTVHCGAAPTIIQDFTDSGRALVSTDERRVSMSVVEHGSTAEQDMSWLDFPYNPRLSRDGSEILFTDQSGQSGSGYSVYIRKRDGSPAVRIGEGGFGTDLSPDGKWAMILQPDDQAARIQLVPVGAGQKRVLHWDGVQPLWAQWYPDGDHILLQAISPPGTPATLFVTDANGATPKMIMADARGRTGVSPDGDSLLAFQNGKRVIQSTAGKETREISKLPDGQFPIAWATDSQHIFTQEPNATGVTIYKVDLGTGQSELWQTIKPKEQIGLRLMVSPVSITPDGRWMAYHYGTQLGQLYVSDSLK